MHPRHNKNDDNNSKLARAVTELTKSEPLNSSECFESPELKRQFLEAKERERLRRKPVGK
jgi:hypothetical protein